MKKDASARMHFPGPTPAFTPVPPETRDQVRALPPSPATMRWAEGQVEALREAEVHNPSFSAPPPPVVRLASWNLRQCHNPGAAAEILAAAGVDIALLSEMDIGLNRSGQHHTLALLAEYLAKKTGIPRGYGAGVEFFELETAENALNPGARPEENRSGFHTNGWLTRFKARRPAIIRLGQEADWFIAPKRAERRVGGRIGVAAIFELGNFDLVAASARLEQDTDPEGRRRQMRQLLESLDDYAARRPVVIGGDFGTGAHGGDLGDKTEGLFREAENFGYDWLGANVHDQTPKTGRENAGRDVFFVRGIGALEPAVIPAIAPDGTAASGRDVATVNVVLPRGRR